MLQRVQPGPTTATLTDIQWELGRRKLAAFARLAWPYVDPATYLHNWHIDAIAEHLQAVNRGEITRLLINIPPRHMKSLISVVMWPVWTWIQDAQMLDTGIVRPTIGPHCKFMTLSYSGDLALRDATKSRELIRSAWFQENYGHLFRLNPGQDAKSRYLNDHGGHRIASSVSGIGTGEGGDIIVVDDANNVKDIESATIRDETIRWYDESMQTRLNQAKYGAFVVIQQRVHERDLTGHILAKNLGYTHLCLPARFDPGHPHVYRGDRRSVPGEPLWPARFDAEALEGLARAMGSYACTPAESPVLMADLSMKPISTVRAGDVVVGFETNPLGEDAGYSRQRLVPAKVKAVHRYPSARVVRMKLDSGEVIRCTPDHKWYRRQRETGAHYAPAKIGAPLVRVCPARLPKIDDLRLAGWLGGFYEGEGTVSFVRRHKNCRPVARIAFYQGAGRNKPLCDKLEAALDYFGFDYAVSMDERKDPSAGVNFEYRCYTLRGKTLPLMQRFLHVTRTDKWRDRMIEGAFGTKFSTGKERVVSIHDDGVEDVFALETETGNYVVWGLASSNSAGQLQQLPAPREGGLFKRHHFEIVDAVPAKRKLVRSWDFAATAEGTSFDPDYTAGVLMSRDEQGFYYVEDVVRFRGSAAEVDTSVQNVASFDGRATKVTVPKDPGSAGKALAAYYTRMLAGYDVSTIAPTGDKVTRATPFAAQVEAGNVKLLRAPWNAAFLDELCIFPNGAHDDQVDAAADAFNTLAEPGGNGYRIRRF